MNVSWTTVDETSTYRVEHAAYSASDLSGSYQWTTDTSSTPGSSYPVNLTTGNQFVFRTTSRTTAGNYGTPSFASQSVLLADVPLAPVGLAYYAHLTQPLGVSVQFTPADSRGSPALFYLASYTISPVDPAEAAVC